MRYLQFPKFFHITVPSLPFRHHKQFNTGAFNDDTQGSRPNAIMMPRSGPRGGTRGFAAKFYDILSEESSDIITWTKSGQAFQVVDYARFSEEILLKYFRHNKFSSFRRQLNLYGYRKVIKGPDAGAYMHPSFQRGRPDLLKNVKKGKVPHYDMHGINEIHGQHFRHHPPGKKITENPTQYPTPPMTARLSPTHDRSASTVTPESRVSGGSSAYAESHVFSRQGVGPITASPSTDTMVGFSNMSLQSLHRSPSTERWADEAIEAKLRQNDRDRQQHTTMDALTLTPAWGGGLSENNQGRPFSGDSLKGRPVDSSMAAGRRVLLGSHQGSGGSAESGDGMGRGSSGSSAQCTPVRQAYWVKQRRERNMSGQLVFPTKPPDNTEAIIQPDPSLSDVMDVICQCMEVRSSAEDSSHSLLSQLSGCSFNVEARRSSVLDLLSSMSWESQLRASQSAGAAGYSRMGSLAGSFRMYDAVFPEEEKDESGKANPAGVAGVGPTGQLNNVHSSYSSKHTSTDNLNNSNNNDNSNSNSKKNQNSHNSHNSRNSSQSERRQQYWPSFDPNGDTDRHATDRNIIEQYARPVVVSSTNSPALEPAGIGKDHTKSQGRPSFDPDRDPVAVQPSLRPRSNLTVPPGAGMVRIQGALEGRREGTAPSSDDPLPGPTSTYAGSREARGVARIFQKSTPPESTGNSEWDRHGGAVVGVAAGGGNNGWREQGSRDKDGYISGAPVGSRAGALEEADWGKPAQHLTPIHTTSTWGLHPGGVHSLLMSPPRPPAVVTGSPTPTAAQQVRQQAGYYPAAGITSQQQRSPGPSGMMSQRSGVNRPMSWVKEPRPERRPTIHESLQINQLLTKPNNLKSWQRVADDEDSMSLAQSIGEFLG